MQEGRDKSRFVAASDVVERWGARLRVWALVLLAVAATVNLGLNLLDRADNKRFAAMQQARGKFVHAFVRTYLRNAQLPPQEREELRRLMVEAGYGDPFAEVNDSASNR